MSSREPMWYCHECRAEMRPLMVPQPTCASCHGTFVEMMENPADDPRVFNPHGLGTDPGQGTMPMDELLFALQTLMTRGLAERRRSADTTGSGRFSFQLRSDNGSRSISIGGPHTLGSRPRDSDPPTMSEFLRREPNTSETPGIAGPLMAQYLLALLGQRHPYMFPHGIDSESMERGRFGDYVFSQEALDQIITQIMESSNTNRPVPAPEEKIQDLPREVLEEGSSLLEKDCAVCKEQFKLESEDPDEQVIITLPCKHPFHEPCIVPWLKSSGTCPVCRYALVAQPEHHPPPGDARPGGNGSPSSSTPRSPGSNRSGEGTNFFQSLFNIMGSASSDGSGSGATGSEQSHSSSNHRSSSDSTNQHSSNTRPHLPGEWHEDLD